MSEQRFTRKRKSLEGVVKDNTEVFVLPPDILQKLGIDLGNVGASLQESAEPSASYDSRPSENDTISHESEPSILQTASLMKNSLLLSPSFGFGHENGPESENSEKLNHEIFGPSTNDLNQTSLEDNINIPEVFKELEVEDIFNTKHSNLKHNKTDNFNSEVSNMNDQVKEHKSLKKLSPEKSAQDLKMHSSVMPNKKNKSLQLTNSELPQDIVKDFRKNADKNSLSNCYLKNVKVAMDDINSNIDIPEDRTKELCSTKYTHQIKESTKLHHGSSIIMSQISNSKYTQENMDTTENIETDINKQQKGEHSNDSVSEDIKHESVNNVVIQKSKNMKIENNMENKLDLSLKMAKAGEIKNRKGLKDTNKLVGNTGKNIDILDKNIVTYVPMAVSCINTDAIYSKSKDSVALISTNTKKFEDITDKNILESKNNTNIKKYEKDNKKDDLKTYIRKKKHTERATDNCAIGNIQEKNNKQLTLDKNAVLKTKLCHNLQHLGGKSKLCIQGVEKPGGDLTTQTNKVETGAKSKIIVLQDIYLNSGSESLNEFSKFNKCTEENKCCQGNIDCIDENVDFVEDVEVSSCYRIGQFCICNDYGKLEFYDNEDVYEHIHFWAHENIECDPMQVLSMYNDLEILKNDFLDTNCESVPEMDTGPKETLKPSLESLCTEDNMDDDRNKKLPEDISNNVDTANKDDNKDLELRKNKTKGKKRKMAFVDEEPALKKSMRCDVCNQILAENEMQIHKNKEHSNVAHEDEVQQECSTEHDSLNVSYTVSEKSIVPAQENLGDSVTCGICGDNMEASLWSLHMAKTHNYLAWKSTESSLDFNNDESIYFHLKNVAKCMGGLVCNKCGFKRKFVKNYLRHVKGCEGVQHENQNSSVSRSDKIANEVVTCGVCGEKIGAKLWPLHKASIHNYLAWRDTENPLELNDEEAIHRYLTETGKPIGGLVCNNCGLKHKYGKQFLKHIRNCPAAEDSSIADKDFVNASSTNDHQKDDSLNQTVQSESPSGDTLNQTVESESPTEVTCGVCVEKMEASLWTEHMSKSHDYLAWKDTETPMDLNNKEALYRHLTDVSKLVGGLVCNKCGLKRKYAKKYLLHVRNCTRDEENQNDQGSLNVSSIDRNQAETLNQIGENMLNCTTESVVDSTTESVVNCTTESVVDGITGSVVNCTTESVLDGTTGSVVNCTTESVVDGITGSVVNCTTESVLDGTTGSVVNCTTESVLDGTTGSVVNCTTESVLDGTTGSVVNCTTESVVTCGVCAENVENSMWTEHMAKRHNYLAWKYNDAPLDLNDDRVVQRHLKDLATTIGGLVCNKCGVTRKYAKSYMDHVKRCTEVEIKEPEIPTTKSCELTVSENRSVASMKGVEAVTCAVCSEKISPEQWMRHIAQKHDYLAWKEGETPLDFNNEEIKHKYLKELCKKMGSLACSKCGLERRYLKAYLTHLKSCQFSVAVSTANSDIRDVEEKIGSVSSDEVVCGVCLKKMTVCAWPRHKMEEHYNLAWTVGQPAIDFKNHFSLKKHLKEYKEKYNALICKNCNAVRGSDIGFVSHILICGKTEEEQESYYITCDKCSKKHLYIYHNQHYKKHTEADYREMIKKEASEKLKIEDNESGEGGGRCRKAAKKAIEVIAKYKTEDSKVKYTHVCESCGYGTNLKHALKSHDCTEADGDYSDSGTSAQFDKDASSDDYDEDDDVINVSEEELIDSRSRDRKRSHNSHGNAIKSYRMLFQDKNNPEEYLTRSAKQYVKYHLSKEALYPEWQQESLEPMTDEEIKECLPDLEESCQVRINGHDWVKFKRFEAQHSSNLSTLFVGASVECVSWAPADSGAGSRNYLAVVCRQGTDAPRLQPDDLHRDHGIIQIWDFGHFNEPPKLCLLLRHGGGTAWGGRWCPSGGRTAARLGLLALPTSDGSAYIYSVPFPPHEGNNNLYYKIKPVVELRLSMNNKRKKYQATSLDWSPEKGHKIIVVGYADGTMGYYDLTVDSPLLKTKENDVTVIYPYHDERVHNACVTDVSICAGVGGSGAGAVGAVSPTAVSLLPCVGARPPALSCRAPAHSITFQPLWPGAIIAGDEAVGVNSSHCVEWWGGVRRAGWGRGRAGAGCGRCARHAAATASSAVAVLHSHPLLDTAKKKMICSIGMTPFAKKRKKLADDNLAIRVEPNTYEDAIKKYGLEFKWVKDGAQLPPTEDHVDRFPLNEVVSMQFCASAAHHDRLALATHAGLVFVVNT